MGILILFSSKMYLGISLLLLFSSAQCYIYEDFIEMGDQRSDGCICGLANRRNRIKGGRYTEANEYPWQALVLYGQSSQSLCGGSLISDRWVLTAAHCAPSRDPRDYQVWLGVHDRSRKFSDGLSKEMSVAEVRVHELYNYLSRQHEQNINKNRFIAFDIALIKLEDQVTFDDHIKPVCLPTM